MKKEIIYSLIVSLSIFFLIGCGSNTKDDPIVDTSGPYSFYNATTPVKITKPTEVNGTIVGNSYEISVQLLKNGLVEPGQSVQMLPFDFTYGSLVNMVVDTDENGKAIFEYSAPEGSDYNTIRGQDITIQAVFLDPEDILTSSTDSASILLTQDFVLQFR